MNRKSFISKFVIVMLVCILTSCVKEGPGGNAEIAVWVKHHDKLIPGATVYIKYGSKEFPGDGLSLYDDSEVCGTEGDDEGHTHFHDLKRGNYYLYAVGYDSSISETVMGGIPVEITKENKDGSSDVEVPVTE
jgi:hypothetical protein